MAVENGNRTNETPRLGYIDAARGKFVITPKHLPYLMYPIVNYVHAAKPNYILALDSGGRIPGLALHLLYQKLYGRLPTIDFSIHFAKVSRKLTDEQIYKRLEPFVNYVMKGDPFPAVFVLDDWINSGRTRSKLTSAFHDLSAGKTKVIFGVMRGPRGDVSGDRLSMATASWSNNAEQHGVKYYNNLTRALAIPSEKAIDLRLQVVKNIENFSKQLTNRAE